MTIQVDLELIATPDYKQLLLEELTLRDAELKLLHLSYTDNPNPILKNIVKSKIRVFNSELKHYKSLFGDKE